MKFLKQTPVPKPLYGRGYCFRAVGFAATGSIFLNCGKVGSIGVELLLVDPQLWYLNRSCCNEPPSYRLGQRKGLSEEAIQPVAAACFQIVPSGGIQLALADRRCASDLLQSAPSMNIACIFVPAQKRHERPWIDHAS